MAEVLDIVNAYNQVIDAGERGAVIQGGKLHRSVHIFVFDSRSRLLVHRRGDGREEYPGYYDGSAAGHVVSGESYFDAAKRELREELGISARPVFLREFSANEVMCHEFTRLYRVLGVPHASVRPDSGEFCEIDWLSLDQISARIGDFAPNFRVLFLWYRRFFGV